MRLTKLLVILLAVAARTPSQTAPAWETLLEKARLVETAEHDHAEAAKMYAAAAEVPDAPAEGRARAWLRSGLCQRRAGRPALAREALRRAAEGAGEAFRLAKSILAGQDGGDDPNFSMRINRSIARLMSSDEPTAELVLVGERAVPYVVQAVRADWSVLAFTTRAMRVLVEVGGKPVAAFFEDVRKSEDVVFRRTIARGLRSALGSEPRNLRRAVRLGLGTFIDDPDAGVREDLFSVFMTEPRFEDVIKLLGDPSLELRALTLNAGRGKGGWLKSVEGHEERTARLVGCLRDTYSRGPESLRFRVLDTCNTSLWQTRAGLDFVAEMMVGLDPRKDSAARAFTSLWVPGSKVDAIADELVPGPSDILAWVRRLTVVDRRSFVLYELAKRFAMNRWSAEQVIELKAQWERCDFAEPWIIRNARPEQAALVARHLDVYEDADDIARWLALNPHPDAVPVLLSWLEGRLEPERPRIEYVKGSLFSLVCGAVVAAAPLVPEAAEELTKLAERHPVAYAGIVFGFMPDRKAVPAEAPARLLALGGSAPGAAGARQQLFQAFIRAGRSDAIPQLVEAHRLGLSHEYEFDDGEKIKTFSDNRPVGLAASRLLLNSPLAPADLARLFDACLATGREEVWRDVQAWFRAERGATWKKLPAAVIRVIMKHVPSAPPSRRARIGAELLGFENGSALHDELLKSMLTDDIPSLRMEAVWCVSADPKWLEPLRQALRDPDPLVVRRALSVAIHHHGKQFLADARSLLGHADAAVRRNALEAVGEVGREAAVGDIVPMLRDPAAPVREAAARMLGQLPSRDAVPTLIETLRDRAEPVRKAANVALSQIRFYFDQVEQWDRWRKGAGLDSTTAADALLEQAKPGGERKIRLAAIRSLGTLAVPETLPILIGYMTDEDEEIAAAAAAAVDAVNVAARKE